MTDASHTPGPWIARKGFLASESGDEVVIDGYQVASARFGDPRHMANADLITAAPELLAVVEDVVRLVDAGYISDLSKIAVAARTAVAKARGIQ